MHIIEQEAVAKWIYNQSFCTVFLTTLLSVGYHEFSDQMFFTKLLPIIENGNPNFSFLS